MHFNIQNIYTFILISCFYFFNLQAKHVQRTNTVSYTQTTNVWNLRKNTAPPDTSPSAANQNQPQPCNCPKDKSKSGSKTAEPRKGNNKRNVMTQLQSLVLTTSTPNLNQNQVHIICSIYRCTCLCLWVSTIPVSITLIHTLMPCCSPQVTTICTRFTPKCLDLCPHLQCDRIGRIMVIMIIILIVTIMMKLCVNSKKTQLMLIVFKFVKAKLDRFF